MQRAMPGETTRCKEVFDTHLDKWGGRNWFHPTYSIHPRLGVLGKKVLFLRGVILTVTTSHEDYIAPVPQISTQSRFWGFLLSAHS